MAISVTWINAQPSDLTEPSLVDIAWSPDGTRLAGIQNNSVIMVWSLDNIAQPQIAFQSEMAQTIEWTPDGQYIITQGIYQERDGLLEMSVGKWDVETGTQVEVLMSFHLQTSLEFNSDAYHVPPTLALNATKTRAAFSFQNDAIWLSDGLSVLPLENTTPFAYVRLMKWSRDSRFLAVVYGMSDIYQIQVIDVTLNEVVGIISQDLQYYITDLDWDASGRYLATSSMRFTCCEGWANIGLYDVTLDDNGIEYYDNVLWKTEVSTNASPLSWHPTAFVLAIATDTHVEVYDPASTDPLMSIDADSLKDLEWSPNGTQIAGILGNGTLRVWDITLP